MLKDNLLGPLGLRDIAFRIKPAMRDRLAKVQACKITRVTSVSPADQLDPVEVLRAG